MVEEIEAKLKVPKKGELFGVVENMMGASHMEVRCQDGVVRTCRVIGKMKKRCWVREGDVVIVLPWTFETKSKKADIVWRYTKNQSQRLKRKGLLDWLTKDEEKELEF